MPADQKAPYKPVIRDLAFAKRLETACENHPHCPPRHSGMLTWVAREMKKRFDEDVQAESVRKWLIGEQRPRPKKTAMLAEMLGVDEAWLTLGIDPDLAPREKKARNAMADAAVNVVTGLIQMDGGHPAFPTEDDKRAQRDNIDIYAIIKGANYAFHVALGREQDDTAHFAIPTKHENAIVVGVIRDGFSFRLFEIPGDVIESRGNRRGGSIELTLGDDFKEIKSFSERL